MKKGLKSIIFWILIIIVLIIVGIVIFIEFPKKEKNTSIEEIKKASFDYYTKFKDNEKAIIRLNELIANDYIKEEDFSSCNKQSSITKIEMINDCDYKISIELNCNTKQELNETIKGKCETKTTYKVTFDSNGGSSIDEQTTKDYINEPSKPTKSGYTFDGWYLNEVHFSFDTKVTKDITLVAHWIKNSSQISTKKSNLYYEFAKIKTTYSDWKLGVGNGDNVENKYEQIAYNYYYKIVYNTYRSMSYIELDDNSLDGNYEFSYLLRLTDIPTNTKKIKVYNVKNFDGEDFPIYYNNQNKNTYSDFNAFLPNYTLFKNAALTSTNFSYTIDETLKYNNVWSVVVKVKVRNLYNKVPEFKNNKYIYYVPIMFSIEYTDENDYAIDADMNWVNYAPAEVRYAYSEYRNIYRTFETKIDTTDTKWSTSTSLDGYSATGKKEWR